LIFLLILRNFLKKATGKEEYFEKFSGFFQGGLIFREFLINFFKV